MKDKDMAALYVCITISLLGGVLGLGMMGAIIWGIVKLVNHFA